MTTKDSEHLEGISQTVAGEDQYPATTKHPGGRPSKYEPWMLRAAAAVARWGATVPEIAEVLGVEKSTVDLWLHNDVEFSGAVKGARKWSDEEVARSLRKRAIGYTRKDGMHIPGHPTAQIFWLKNRQPDKWRDRIEHTGADGQSLGNLDAQQIVDGLVALTNAHPITALPLRKLLQSAIDRIVIPGEPLPDSVDVPGIARDV